MPNQQRRKRIEFFPIFLTVKPFLFEGFNEAEKSELFSKKSATVGNMIQAF